MANSIPIILEEELARLHEDIVKRYEQTGQVATGKTREAFEHYLTSDSSGVMEGAAHIKTAEEGRGPAQSGNDKTKEEFIENLKEWILVRGLDYGNNIEGLERLAKFFRWWLNQFGSKMYREGKKEDIFTTPIDEFTDRLSNRITVYFESEIKNKLLTE